MQAIGPGLRNASVTRSTSPSRRRRGLRECRRSLECTRTDVAVLDQQVGRHAD
jgi:hypothetical protein